AIGLVVANGVEEIVVLLLIRIFAFLLARHPLTVFAADNVATDVAGAFGADAIFRDAIPTVQNVAALAGATPAVRVFELHAMMVEDFAVIRAFAHFASAHAVGANGVTLLEPIDHVEVVNVLLDDVIAAQPNEVVPVAHLIFHLREIAPGFLFQLSPR